MEREIVDERYEVFDFLGGGGMAEVYLARDAVLDRDVALKFMKGAGDEEAVERFCGRPGARPHSRTRTSPPYTTGAGRATANIT